MVTLSYGYKDGFLNDCGDVSQTYGGFTEDWSANETEDGLTATLAVDNGDYYKILSSASSGNRSVYYEYPDSAGANNLSVSSTTYPLIRWRYKTDSAYIKAKIVLVFSDASTQTVLDESQSTTFSEGTATITSGKTIDHIRIYAVGTTDSGGSIGSVYYDFIKIYKGDFTLPNAAGGMNMDFPPQEALLDIPGRDVNLTQNLGTKSAVVTLSCDLDQGTWTRTGDTVDGEVFLELLHNRSSEPWQWLETGSHKFKVTVHPRFRWVNNGDGSTSRLLDLTLKEYSLGDKSEESYAERFGV